MQRVHVDNATAHTGGWLEHVAAYTYYRSDRIEAGYLRVAGDELVSSTSHNTHTPVQTLRVQAMHGFCTSFLANPGG